VPGAAKDDRARTRKILRELDRCHPDARFELDFSTPLELLIALILAAQFRDDRVNAITPALFARYRTARDYAAAPPAELETLLREVNFFRQKTKAVQLCTAEIVARFAGEVPRDLEALLTLPYVGRKTANVLRGNAFGITAIGVDRHVARLAQRIGLTREDDPDRIEAELVTVVAPAEQVRFCHLLQWHGRRVCLARGPLCEVCMIQPLCDFGRSPAARATKPTRKRPPGSATSPAAGEPRAPRKPAPAKSRGAQSGRKKSTPPR